MDARAERRSPDRRIFVLYLLRKVALYALAASAALWAVPKLLVELGAIGPGPDEVVATASRALEAARTYGAGADIPAFAAAEKELARARDLAGQGRGRECRRASKRAQELAVEAQRVALVRQDETRHHAEIVYNDLDRQINDLEKLYSSVTPGLEKEKVSQLLSLMKVTRASAALLFLAYEQQDYRTVVEGEPKARSALAEMRARLEAAKR